MNKNKHTLIDTGILVGITLLAYFPVSFFLFSLKNDSLVQYLPFRYHVSEAIQHGFFPFWSPYLYTGFPVHADMQGMTWNPVVLLISIFTRYNMSVLEFEVTIYLALAAIGMYRLLKSFGLNRMICLVGGISYMSCGFINGSASVIPWISSAAFIPFVFTGIKIFLESPRLKNAVLFAAALSLLFVCGYPTFFIYTCYVLASILIYALILHRKQLNNYAIRQTALLFFLAGIIFLLVCSPAIISYAEFLPEYSRGAGITAAKAAENPFTPYSGISFLLHNAVHKQHAWLNTDTSMRNSYVGLFVIGLFGLSLLFRKTNWQKFILGATIISFLLSLGSYTPLHKLAYYILPLFNTFRHPGNLRLFTSIGIILLAAGFMQQLLSRPKEERNRILLKGLYTMGVILLLPVVYSLFFESGVIKNIREAITTRQPKVFLDTLRFPSMLLILGLLQLIFLGKMYWLLKRKGTNKTLFAMLIGANSILFCWIALPFNFISQIRTSEVNKYVASFPGGYPLPDINESVGPEVISDSTKFPVYGYPNFYSKKISVQDYIITPTLNKTYEEFNGNKKLRTLFKGYPFAWLNDTIVSSLPETLDSSKRFTLFMGSGLPDIKRPTNSSVKLNELTPNQISLTVNSDAPSLLSIFQQYNKNWRARVNGQDVPVFKVNIAFMGIPVSDGKNEIILEYKPSAVILCMWISLAVILLLAIYFLFKAVRKSTNG